MGTIIEKIKNIFKGNNQKVIFLASAVLVMVLIIITIVVATKIVGVKVSYEILEQKLENATHKYLSENPLELPNEDKSTIVVNANTLVEKKYIKELKKYVKDSSCTANIVVDYLNNDYKYQAYLTCNDFKTQKLVDTLKNNNKVSSTGEGLYEMNGELVYRGENPNNYVNFADRIWRIVKIDNNGNIKMIISTEKAEIIEEWDNRYNTEKKSAKGINNFLLSRAFANIQNFYNNKLSGNNKYLTTYDLCVGKRLEDSTDKSGALECSEKIENQYIGLLPIYDYLNASLDGLCQTTISKECQNYNYLTNNKNKWWTMTADSKNTHDAFYISLKGVAESEYANTNAQNRYVVALKSDVLFKSGNGTSKNPYQIR